MPIEINGSSNTITGLAVGGLPDGVVDTDMVAANAVTTAKLATSPQQGLAKAWINFNLGSGGSIRDDFNISTIVDNGTGLFTVNFSTAMADANYSTISTASNGTQEELTSSNYNRIGESTAHTSTKFSVACYAPNNAVLVDVGYCGVAVFGD
tara:strand:- start:396 stop:851 length:456 start_codon:yes stop_codon:yes gene_type:complete